MSDLQESEANLLSLQKAHRYSTFKFSEIFAVIVDTQLTISELGFLIGSQIPDYKSAGLLEPR